MASLKLASTERHPPSPPNGGVVSAPFGRYRPAAMNGLTNQVRLNCGKWAAILSIFASQLLSVPAHASQPDIVGVASVTDGDSIVIHGQRIRLHGIDAPESGQTCELDGTPWRCGQKASLALSDRIGRNTVRCEHLGTDRYRRIIGRCWEGATDLNAWMVEQGWAVAYLRYSREYARQEEAAKNAKRGIWAGTFDMPWEWRAARRK